MEYRPSLASFAGSVLYGFTPVITAGIVMYFLWDSTRWIVWVASGFMLILSLYLTVQTICVHLQKLYLDDYGIGVSGPTIEVAMRWQDVISAVLRERNNLMSRTDHLLILESVNQVLSYNTSTLTKKDESEVLELVKKKTHLIIKKDKPTI